MKVEVKSEFVDKHTGRLHSVGEVFECTEERFKEILQVGKFVSAVTDPTPAQSTRKERSRKKVSE